MNYWRMQLHPSDPSKAVQHCIDSLASGYIGLDFEEDLGDLFLLKKEDLPNGQRDFWDFAHILKPGDWVLIIAHHFPFSLVRVSTRNEEGEYNYIRRKSPEIGVWFRYFRKVDVVMYFSDYVTNARNWEQVKMTDTISILKDESSKSYRLISQWLKDAGYLG